MDWSWASGYLRRESPNLFANPSDAVWSILQTLNDRGQESFRDFGQHLEAGCNDSLHLDILRCKFGSYRPW